MNTSPLVTPATHRNSAQTGTQVEVGMSASDPASTSIEARKAARDRVSRGTRIMITAPTR